MGNIQKNTSSINTKPVIFKFIERWTSPSACQCLSIKIHSINPAFFYLQETNVRPKTRAWIHRFELETKGQLSQQCGIAWQMRWPAGEGHAGEETQLHLVAAVGVPTGCRGACSWAAPGLGWASAPATGAHSPGCWEAAGWLSALQLRSAQHQLSLGHGVFLGLWGLMSHPAQGSNEKQLGRKPAGLLVCGIWLY